MLGITDGAEVALSYLWLRQNQGTITVQTSVLPTYNFVELRNAEMIRATFDWGHTTAFVHDILPRGVEHFQLVQRHRRKFASLMESSDELIGLLYLEMVEHRAADKSGDLTVRKGRVEDYRELGRAGLLDNRYADNMLWKTSITEKGISYVRGDFIEEGAAMNVEISPVFNNSNTVTTTSQSSATSTTGNVSVESVIQDIRSGELSTETKQELEDAIVAIGRAASSKDQPGFLSSLEKIASIAKNTASTGAAVLPLLAELFAKYFPM